MRVVSLHPPATEMLYALGHEPAAVSHACDYPPEAEDRPSANRSRVDASGTAAAIDLAVDRALADHGGVYELDEAVLERAEPDLVVTQGTCEVCAVDDARVRAALERLGLEAKVVSTHPHGLDDVLADLERIGAAIDRAEEAATLVARLRDRIEEVRGRTSGLDRPRTTVLDWTDPVMVAGHWVPDMVEAAGGTYGPAAPGERSRTGRWGEVRRFDPKHLVVAPCGFPLDRAVTSAADLRGLSGWDDLAAVREGSVVAMDGDAYINRPGPRLVDAVEHLAGLLHPEVFPTPTEAVVRPVHHR